jgi:hypothetical protein
VRVQHCDREIELFVVAATERHCNLPQTNRKQYLEREREREKRERERKMRAKQRPSTARSRSVSCTCRHLSDLPVNKSNFFACISYHQSVSHFLPERQASTLINHRSVIKKDPTFSRHSQFDRPWSHPTPLPSTRLCANLQSIKVGSFGHRHFSNCYRRAHAEEAVGVRARTVV